MTAILKEEPPDLPASVRQRVPELARILDRCLAKDPDGRFTSANDLSFALEGVASSSSSREAASIDAGRSVSRSKWWLATAAGGALVSLLTAVTLAPLFRYQERVDDQPAVRLQLTLPDDVTPVRGQSPAVSPDGTRVAMVAMDQVSGKRLIYLRPLNSLAVQPIRGTDRAVYPFWSANGSKMGFFADGRLKVVDLATGTGQDVCAVPNPGGPGIWADDTIVFPRTSGPLHRVSALGGTSVPSTPFDAAHEVAQSVAGFLRDRRRFVFGTNAFGASTLRIGSTEGSLAQPLAAAGSRGLLHTPWLSTPGVGDGHLLFVRESALFAVGLNGESGQSTGDPEALAQSIAPLSSGAASPFSVQDAVLAYVSSANSASRLVWVNQQGQTLAPAGPLTGLLRDVRISPDGALATVSRFNDADRVYDLMLIDLRRMTASQLTYGTSAFGASWLPDQSAIVFTNVTAKGSMLVRMAPREGAALVPVVPAADAVVWQSEISPDGQHLAYARTRVDGNSDIYLHTLKDRADERPLLATPPFENSPRFSPDGAWIAYQSNETGTPEVSSVRFLRATTSSRFRGVVAIGACGGPTARRCSTCLLMAI